ncbi:hypothetical protein, partial [Falsihalocynthiibacter sp. CO-5D18]|uniref:hypothetical protein n=1 Tax=Falsihalocynthiibacter sp. CO-5D18 TaxID=3240872 RepID=UPI00350F8807
SATMIHQGSGITISCQNGHERQKLLRAPRSAGFPHSLSAEQRVLSEANGTFPHVLPQTLTAPRKLWRPDMVLRYSFPEAGIGVKRGVWTEVCDASSERG